MASTRRLAAILAADVAGFTSLIEADLGGTLGALRAIRRDLVDPTIEAHNGRLLKQAVTSCSLNLPMSWKHYAVQPACRGHWPSTIATCQRESASSFGSAFIRGMWSFRMAISSAMG